MNTEQEKFDTWLVSLSIPTDKYVMSLWWGSAATMPTYRDSWTEAQWVGWKARANLEKPNLWKTAIDEALVVSCLDCIGDDETPEKALARLIEWEIEIALDPTVSSRAAALAQPEQPDTAPWPTIESFSGGASPEGLCGTLQVKLGDGPELTAFVRAQPEQQAEPKPSDRRPYGDLRNAKWLDPECYGAGACQSLKFKAAHPPAQPSQPEQRAPAGYLYQHDETGRTTFRDELDPNMGPRWYAIPLYAQPIK